MIEEKPEKDRDEYIATVLKLYLQLPETPLRSTPHDRERASQLHQRGITLPIIESALLLGSLRRLSRPPEAPRLPLIRSLAYFVPVIEELLDNPFPEGYLDYLRGKLRRLVVGKIKHEQTGARSEKYVSS
ncbi:MAG TPA: hypothetical protein VGV87_23940 [Blastocatellia bacterium]|jgi:hypothetical protein|nr:hypothetical protein [Blastocatellia bacterium]